MAADSVDEYIAGIDESLRPVAEEVRRIIVDELPDSDEAIKWSQPTYRVAGKHVAYLKATKKHLSFGLTQGRQLDDPDGRLQGGGQQMAHVKLTTLDDIDEDQFRDWLRQAAELARS
ncbi:MAG TPA: DUF1801 domain-containing protein [Nitriliruptorales bacterium]|nr:DUF1801 domain-containing protein [Nitriliruptorales bacterium]